MVVEAVIVTMEMSYWVGLASRSGTVKVVVDMAERLAEAGAEDAEAGAEVAEVVAELAEAGAELSEAVAELPEGEEVVAALATPVNTASRLAVDAANFMVAIDNEMLGRIYRTEKKKWNFQA